MRKEIIYRYTDVVLEQQWQPKQVEKQGTDYVLTEEHDSHKPIGRVTNVRWGGIDVHNPDDMHKPFKLFGDVESFKDLKGLYPSLRVQILEKDGTTGEILKGKLLSVGACQALNIDETLEPFI